MLPHNAPLADPLAETDPNAPLLTAEPIHIPRVYGAILGLASALIAVATGMLVASFGDSATPIDAVGSSFIDRAPSWLKELAIALFDTNNKTALRVGIWIVLIIAACAFGIASTKKFTTLVIGFAVFAVIGVAAAVERPGTDTLGFIAPIIGVTIGIACAKYLLTIVQTRTHVNNTPTESRVPLGWDRRRFLQSATAISAVAVGVGTVGRIREVQRIDNVRSQIPETLPPVPLSETVSFSETGFHPTDSFVTPTSSFYRIDTALSFPTINLEKWKVRIHGLVDTEIELTYADLIALPQVERMITLSCVSNPIGGRYIGNAVWQGVLLRDVLNRAGVQGDAQQVFSRSVDGWTCGFPVQAALDGRDALIAIGMNNEPLSLKHGFPARLVIPGLYGYVSATKWLSEIELTTWDKRGYWIPRGWSQIAPIKTQSRIDVPRSDTDTPRGNITIAGVAWAQHVGIEKVEVRIDDGPWQVALLSNDVSDDTWRQWTLSWDASPGDHVIQVRATDKSGYTQTDVRTGVAPDGATGWHTRRVRIS
jgi:DMSO/TMAO reductase YedYZ molybdopterin-dependent catalytic subunit